MTPDPCPSDEELAAFHAGILTQADNDRVAAHLGRCPKCETKLHVLDGRTGSLADGRTDNWQPPSEPAAGVVIAGRYKLIEPLGEGGMGTVWMAQQTEPIKRLVALKLIKAGMDSKIVLARFEAERQALAMMDHPNIAKVLDAGAVGSGQ